MKNNYVYSQAEWSAEDPKEIIVQHIKQGAHVLDVGCGAGGLGRWLITNRGAEVDGLEFHPDAVKLARKHLGMVKQVDLNNLPSIDEALGKKVYDVITLVDVLEHCLYPEQVLKILTRHVKPTGKFIVSLPNVAHHSVRFGLLRGKFTYAESGILDRTHVRFYTRESMADMLKAANLHPTLVGNTSPHSGIWSLVAKLAPALTAIQFVYEAHVD